MSRQHHMRSRDSGFLCRALRDRRGSTAVEFALTVPMLMVFLFGIFQLGLLFFANAGLQNALGEAAREATLWPRRSEAQMTAVLNQSRFGMDPQRLGQPVFTHGTEAGQDFVEISATYTTSINMLMFSFNGVTLSHSRRAYRP